VIAIDCVDVAEASAHVVDQGFSEGEFIAVRFRW
jgi:hypothetical protein